LAMRLRDRRIVETKICRRRATDDESLCIRCDLGPRRRTVHDAQQEVRAAVRRTWSRRMRAAEWRTSYRRWQRRPRRSHPQCPELQRTHLPVRDLYASIAGHVDKRKNDTRPMVGAIALSKKDFRNVFFTRGRLFIAECVMKKARNLASRLVD